MAQSHINSFIALAQTATPPDRTQFVPGRLGKDDSFARERLIAWQGEQRMAVGHINWDGPIRHAQFPHTELLIVQNGVMLLESATEVLRVAAGEAVLIPQGATVSIQAESPLHWIFCSVSTNNGKAISAKPAIQRINLTPSLTPSAPPSAEVLLSAEPQCRSSSAYSDDSSRTRIGIWDSTPYTRKQVPHRVNELMYLLEGSVTLTDANGHAQTFNQGDIVFVPRGTLCAWHSAVMVRKLYWVQEFPA
jgi:uncharacterized cupin superfamily protein